MITWLSGEKHRRRRAIVLRYFSGEAAKKHQNIQVDETRVLIKNLVDDPKHLFEHLKLCLVWSLEAHVTDLLAGSGLTSSCWARMEFALRSTMTLGSWRSTRPSLQQRREALWSTSLMRSPFVSHIPYRLHYANPLEVMGYPKWFPFSGFRIRAEQSVRIVEECCRYRPFNECKAMLVCHP
jgi:hypothetical protein